MAMGFVLFFVCGPAFVIALIAGILAAKNPLTKNRMLVIALSLLALQAIFWLTLIIGSILHTSSPSSGRAGGF